MCGASDQQKQIEQAQADFYNQLTTEYQSEFSQNQAILSALTKSFEPILAAGINQQGFSPEELATLNSQAETGSGKAYADAKAAVANQQAAEGGGNTYLPSGAKQQQNLELATSAAQNKAGIESNILANDYAQGRQDYLTAAQVLGGTAAQMNPAEFANAATGAGSAASTTANEITQANNSWMNLVAGGLSAAATAYAGRK